MNQLFHKLQWTAESTIDVQALQQFFLNEQKITKTEKECLALINKYNNSLESHPFLTRSQFSQLFKNEAELFNLFNPVHYNVCQPMDQPMTHYFIASSHNTYLTGNQLTSKSSVDMYKSVLLEGCRCVEIDIWHRGNKTVVTHGHTLTSQISFFEVLTTINKYAFARSPFPLILSIENHLEIDQQKTMAQMLKKVFTNKLFIGNISPSETTFPSPNQFKRKIFIKGKKIPDEYFEGNEQDDLPPSYEELYVIPKNLQLGSFKKPQFLPKSEIKFHANGSSEKNFESENFYKSYPKINFDKNEPDPEPTPTEEPFELQSLLRSMHRGIIPKQKPQTELRSVLDQTIKAEASVDQKPKIKQKSTKQKLDQEFSDMVTYFQSKKYINFSDCKTFKFYEMISHSESGSTKIIKSNRHAYRRFASTNMVRVYPNGLRIDSSNYCPLKHWAAGAQLVALNYQTLGLTEKYTPMLLNQALFRLNGNCGYVLKPKYLRTLEKPNLKWQHLKIRIISAELNENVFVNSANFYVTVKLFAPHRQVEKWSTGRVNTFNPVWNIGLKFCNIKYAEITFIQIILKSNQGLLGLHTISIEAMQEGYRKISLTNEDFKTIESTSILVHVKRRASSDRHLKLTSSALSLGCFH